MNFVIFQQKCWVNQYIFRIVFELVNIIKNGKSDSITYNVMLKQ